MSKSIPKRKPWKVAGHVIARPYALFPLSPHASGNWCKRIRGELHYFGKWARKQKGELVRVEGDGWQEALEQYKAQADDLHAGRTPQTKNTGALTVLDLVNLFLTAKFRQWQAGELCDRMFSQKPGQDPKGEYPSTCELLLAAFGKGRAVEDLRPADFDFLREKLAKRLGPHRLSAEVQKVRTICKYAVDSQLIDKPVFFGPNFKKPSKTAMRRHRAQKGPRMFSADEVKRLIDAASPQLRAMIYLGINAGYGNSDCAQLPMKALDLAGGWATFPRPKTGLERRARLWPETCQAIREALASRPEPKDPAHAELVFITKYGQPWEDKRYTTAITHETKKLLRRLGIDRPGLGLYALRHVFRTVADATHDFPAIRLVMGHADASIDAVYREGIDDARLVAVSEHVRRWLFHTVPVEGEAPDVLPMVPKTA